MDSGTLVDLETEELWKLNPEDSDKTEPTGGVQAWNDDAIVRVDLTWEEFGHGSPTPEVGDTFSRQNPMYWEHGIA